MRRTRRVPLLGFAVVAALAGEGSSAAAQTLRGTLLDRETNQPIAVARLFLIGSSGDTVAVGVSSSGGAFSLRSPEAGDFYLSASVLGYRETTVGVFELSKDGEISVEFRIMPAAIEVEGITVNLEGVVREPWLISNGFYGRLQSGLGRFLTPADIEKSRVLKVTELLYSMPRVDVVSENGRDRVMMMSPLGACAPNIYVDGLLMSTDGRDVDMIAPLIAVEAVEVYVGAAQLPLQWSGTGARGCGAIVIWTKR